MKVELINCTYDAVNLLLLTKNTRLIDDDYAYEKIRGWPWDEKQKELEHMLNTIRSSWEFIDYIFSLRGVSRAFTHQLVRTRNASYAQQSQRVVDMSGFNYYTPLKIEENPKAKEIYDECMEHINKSYQLIRNHVPPEDARGLLPTNINANIIAKFNLRTLSEMAKSRLSPRAQGEYQKIFKLMIEEVIKVHPWAEPFLTPKEWAAPSMATPLNREETNV